MPLGFHIDSDRSVIFVRGWGTVTDADVRAHSAALRGDPRFDPKWPVLGDGREIADLRVTGGFLRHYQSPFDGSTKRAFVVTSDVVFGMARMYGFLATDDDSAVAVMRSLPSACEWLGMPADTPFPQVLDVVVGEPSALTGEKRA
jgi:hypothetical protein